MTSARASAPGERQEWTTRQERGAVVTIRFMVWVAMRLGRSAARLLLHPITAYFVLFSTHARRASRDYLERVLGRSVRLADIYRHYHEFACCILDRVYLLNDRADLFDLNIHGEDVLFDLSESGAGCMLFGAHLGSFEVLRLIGRQRQDLRVSVVMYEDNARKINSVLNAINPELSMDIISLGRPSAMIEIGERLASGGFVGVLADRSLNLDEQVKLPFLGTEAPFATGPFRVALLMKQPVVMMVGLYRGGRRYDIYFERLFDPSEIAQGRRADALKDAMARYVERLEYYCRIAPYNWFNFYDFWNG